MKKRNRKRQTVSGPSLPQTLMIGTLGIGLLVFAGSQGGEVETNHLGSIVALLLFFGIILTVGIQMVKDGDWVGWVLILAVLVAVPWNIEYNGSPSMAQRSEDAVESLLIERFK